MGRTSLQAALFIACLAVTTAVDVSEGRALLCSLRCLLNKRGTHGRNLHQNFFSPKKLKSVSLTSADNVPKLGCETKNAQGNDTQENNYCAHSSPRSVVSG